METRRALLVDTFAAEPTGGLPIAVLPEAADLTDEQLQAAASELGTTAAGPTTAEGPTERLRVHGPSGPLERRDAPTDHTLVALVAALGHDRETGSSDIETANETWSTEVSDDGRVWVETTVPAAESVDVDYGTLADSLGVDVATLEDVGADLPPLRMSVGADTLAVPVNFLEHLSGAGPDRSALATVAASADVAAVCAYTFDTLDADAAAHARTFVVDDRQWPRTVGAEVPVTPAVAGGLVAHLHSRGTVETAQTAIEQGHFCDRPGRVYVDATAGLRVGGRAVTSLSGTVTLPEDDEDEIIEA